MTKIADLSPSQLALTSVPPGPRERRVALIVIGSSVATLALMTPFARVPLARVDAFIPSYEAALAISDLITACLLFGQFLRLRLAALLLLAAAYLFDVLLIVPHALTFPGVFTPSGLLGARPQTTAWIYAFWHGGFALIVLAYAVVAGRPPPRIVRERPGPSVLVAIVGTFSVAGALTLLTTVGHDLLPIIINGRDYSMLISKGVSPAICGVSLLAIFLLWRRRNQSTLDLWMLVVMCAWLCDVMLSAVVGSQRYDLGFYGGRTYGLIAASLLLIALLLELNHLYAKLGEALLVAENRNTELLESRQQLAHAQRLEAMGQLTGGVAHDFNNLLMVVTGSLDMILRSPGNAAKVERLAKLGLDATSRGQKLTQQLLTFARKHVSHAVTVNPNHLIANFDALLRKAVGFKSDIVCRLDPEIHAVSLDATQFEAAILNLAVNARDAMPTGGTIVIETKNSLIDSLSAARENLAPGKYVVVSVADRGVGMSEEVKDQAFDPFFTTKEVGRGSGLGLSQVYGFAKSAGGFVKIYSEPGAGTVVRMYLPRSLEQAVPAEATVNSFPLRAARGDEAVLAVEDDEAVLELAVQSLQDLGYRVTMARSATEAVDILRSATKIDLLFSDVIMPGGMNGAQLAVEARRIRPSLKVLLTSGFTAQALTREHGLPPDLEVLGKPYRHEELANKLRLVLSAQ